MMEERWNKATSKPLDDIETLLKGVTQRSERMIEKKDWRELEEVAETILAKIKAREIHGIAYVVQHKGGGTGHGWFVLPKLSRQVMLGGISMLTLDLGMDTMALTKTLPPAQITFDEEKET